MEDLFDYSPPPKIPAVPQQARDGERSRTIKPGMNDQGEPAEASAQAGMLRRKKKVSISETPGMNQGNVDKTAEERQKNAPLADRMRPEGLDAFFGQDDIVGEGKMLRQAIESDQVPSIIFWGPPGTGKTTLARIIAAMTSSTFILLHAVTSGVADLRKIIKEAEERQRLYGKRTILFIDEIHRWNKSQQDALLPYVENGTLTLIGATTENPSFEVVGALLSRCRVVVLKKLSAEHIRVIIERALKNRAQGLGRLSLRLADATIDFLSRAADGDARVALNALEIAPASTVRPQI